MYIELTELITLLSLVSVATERVVEIAKPLLPKPNPQYTTTMYSLMAYFISLVIMGVSDIRAPLISDNIPIQHIILALACTAGSGFWNDLLKLVQGLKIKT